MANPSSTQPLRLVQFRADNGGNGVGVVTPEGVLPVKGADGMYTLAMAAIHYRRTLSEQIHHQGCDTTPLHLQRLIDEKRLLPPLTHPDPAHCYVTGTGLTHLGSASARDQMHQKLGKAENEMTDSMRMFKWGVDGGHPSAGEAGVQPEWFYKGDGSMIVTTGEPLPSPDFALDGGEEPEIVGVYIVGPNRRPYRLGFALGNEFSDHVTERKNYLYLAHSKLRPCAVGPELRTGELPQHLEGISRIRRGGNVIWEKPFLTGEANMCHSIANLEYHHFKYAQFLRPGDVHLHYFGTGTLSIADGVQTQEGDVFEISIAEFGAPLANPLSRHSTGFRIGQVQRL